MLRKFSLIASLIMILGIFMVPIAGAQGPAFDPTAAEEEGYWYSRYNLGNLVMRSGLGETFMPEKSMMQAMMKMVDADPNDGDAVVPPVNAALLKSVYAGADPHYITTLDPPDFGTQRWDPASFDATVTSQALGWTMIKESEWAKQFHVDNHFGTPTDNFGAQWRFVGLVLNAESKMQAQFALQMLKNEQGLIANSDDAVDWTGQWVMLEAFSDLGGLLTASEVPHSTANRYHDPKAGGMFLGAADMLFGALASRRPAGVTELSQAIQGLTWYAANTTNVENQAAALALISQHGDALLNAPAGNATGQATSVRGLIEAYRVSGNDKYRTGAGEVFNNMAANFEPASGVFAGQNSYTINDVATIMGGINSARLFGGDAVDQTKASELFGNFFESAVNKSGLQQSVPPIPVAKGKFEQDEPPVFYGYPDISMPPMAGGEFGVAPVFATEVNWNGSQWSVADGRFDSAGAMHASNEFIWFHNDEVNGFPEVTVLATAAPATLPATGADHSLPVTALLLVVGGLLLAGGGLALRRVAVKR